MNKIAKESQKTSTKDKTKVGQVIELPVTALDEEGYSHGVYEDLPVKMTGGFPGELVRARITSAGRHLIFADIVKILRRIPDRLGTPPCAKADTCDGCPFIQMKYSAQLVWKTALVAKEIRRFFPPETLEIHPAIPSPKNLHYRNSAKLVVSGKFAAPAIGIYRRGSHDVVDIGDCPLHHPLINKVVQATRDGIRKGKVPVYSARTGTGLLRYLVVRVSEQDSKAMVVFVTTKRSFNEIHHLAKYVQAAVPEVAVVVQNVNDSTGNVVFGPRDYFVTKEQALSDNIGAIRFSISPRSFFQVNSGGARIVYDKVHEFAALTGQETVVDLYCGVGGISFFLARDAKEVLGIEVAEAAVIDAEKNAALNDIRNCSFTAGDANKLLVDLHRERKNVDLIVLNPPRKGCDERVLSSAALLSPAKMIYVSCSPATLARDLSILYGHGYRTSTIQPVDMFPQTPHVESVALLLK